MKMPKQLPYLFNRWDRLDEYHQLDLKVTKEEFASWFAFVFKKLKIKTFEDIKNIRPYEILYLAKADPVNYYGNFETDFFGGMFGVMGMYIQDFFNPFLPDYFSYKGEKKNQAEKRFLFIQQLIEEEE